MNSKRIGWVLAGDRDGQHGVIDSDLEIELAQEVARRIDFPGNLPSEVGRSELEAVGAFSMNEYFIFYSIASDEDAPRPGMARAGAILVALNDTMEMDDPASPIEMARAVRRSGKPGNGSTPKAKPLPCAPLIERLLAGTALVPAECDTAMLLRSLWSSIPKDLRPKIFASLCFSHSDLPIERIALGFMPSIVKWTVPDEMWVSQPFASPEDGSDTIVAALAGGMTNDIDEFASKSGFLITNMKDIRLVERIRHIVGKSSPPAQLISALRFSVALGDSGKKGDFESTLIEQLVNHEDDIRVDDVLSMRNLHLEFQSLSLEEWLSRWVESHLENDEDEELLHIISEMWNKEAALWWKKAITSGVKNFAGSVPLFLSSYSLDLVCEHPSRARDLFGFLDTNRNFDTQLSSAIRARSSPTITDLVGVITPQAIPITYTTAFLSGGPGPASIFAEISRVGDEDGFDLSPHISAMVDAEDISALASEDSEMLLCRSFADRVVVEPKSFETVDPALHAYQRTLAYVLMDTSKKLKAAVRKLVDRALPVLLEGQELETHFVESLSGREDYNLLDHPDRAKLWDVLPSQLLTPLLDRTAVRWFGSIDKIGETEVENTLKKELASSRFSSERRKALAAADLDSWTALADLETAPGYEFKQRLDKILRNTSNLKQDSVSRMARLIASKRMSDLVRTLVREHHARSDLRPAWPLLDSMLGFLDRLFLPGISFTQADWDAALEQVMCGLYPEGPSEDLLWERAGGDMSDITSQKNGRYAWKLAIRRAAKGSEVTRRKLLNVSQRDYPANKELRALRDSLR